MRNTIAAHIPTHHSGPFQSVQAGDAVMAELFEYTPEEPPELTLEEKLAAEFELGRKEGVGAATEHYETQLAEERQDHVTALEELKAAHEAELAALINDGLTDAFAKLEDRLASAVAAVMEPLVEDKIAARIVGSFRETLEDFLDGDEDALVRVSGPQNLLDLFGRDLGGLESRTELVVKDSTELTAILGETSLETRLADWMTQLTQAMEAD